MISRGKIDFCVESYDKRIRILAVETETYVGVMKFSTNIGRGGSPLYGFSELIMKAGFLFGSPAYGSTVSEESFSVSPSERVPVM